MNSILSPEFLAPTKIIDSDHPLIAQYAQAITQGNFSDPVAVAVALYYKVRDDILYNPYVAYHREESYQASNIIKRKKGYCVSKASLLCALGRHCGIPSRIGFATVRNHIATQQLIDLMGTNEFAYHGYTEFYLNGKWVIATPAFDKKTCDRHGVAPLEFTGVEDSKYQALNTGENLFLEYLEYHGSYSDVPVDHIIAEFRKKYGNELVQKWIDAFDSMRGIAARRFEQETVVN
jgi:transglutaminase-like putative cysteine protease